MQKAGAVSRWACRPWWWGAAIAAGVAACGGGGGGGADAPVTPPPPPPALTADYFPLAAGERRVYLGRDGLEIVTTVGPQTLAGRTVWLQRTENDAGSSETQIEKTAAGVFRLPAPGVGAQEATLAGFPLLRLPVVLGRSELLFDGLLPEGADLDGDNRPDSVSLRLEVTPAAVEALSVPAGSWPDALRVRTVQRQEVRLSSRPGLGPSVLSTTRDDWFVPGLGLVRTLRVDTRTDLPADTQDRPLRAYDVAGRRSDTTAPTLASRSPTDGSTVSDALRVVAVFSEPMNPRSLPEGGFQVRAPNGDAVPGATEWLDARTLRFTPSSAVAQGAGFEVQLAAGLSDELGNPLGATAAWRFGVDSRGPQLLASQPAAGAAEVDINAMLRLDFDEEPDPATVDSNSITLNGPAGAVALNLQVQGRSITLTPLLPLQQRSRYTLQIGTTLRDRLGNAGGGRSIEFRTDPGRFAEPAAGPVRPGTEATLIADLDGDGRADLLRSFRLDNLASLPQSGVEVRLQQPDGSLGAPVQTLLGFERPLSLAVLDLDGDGRRDVVVGQRLAPLQLLLQNPDGALVPAGTLGAALAGWVQAVDLDADGTPELVAAQQADTVRFFRRVGAGGYAPAADLSAPGGIDAWAVADLDADGRPDLLLAQAGSDGLRRLVLWRQSPDGSYAAPLALAGPWNSQPVSALAVGDVDGDGRADVAATLGGNAPAAALWVWRQRSAGVYSLQPAVPVLDAPASLRVADLDGDGRNDLAIGHPSYAGVSVLLQRADGALAAPVVYRSPLGAGEQGALAVGDLNGDGRPDLAQADGVMLQRAVTAGASRVPRPAATLRAPVQPRTSP